MTEHEHSAHGESKPVPYGMAGTLFLIIAAGLVALSIGTNIPFFSPKAVAHGESPKAEQGGASHTEAAAPAASGHDAKAEKPDAKKEGHGDGHSDFVPAIPWVLPFAGILLVVAIFPLLPTVSHFWEKNSVKLLVSVVLGAPVGIYIYMNSPANVKHAGIEYFQFLSLLTALFITAGGLHLTGDLKATPRVNSIFLLIGYVIASLIGTTGAAMVLIYPLLRTNAQRKFKAHTVIFFIFLVCNTGGLLTPIGDPPLFLGYLRGIEFFWFLKLAPMWALNGLIMFAIYFALDSHYFRKEEAKDIAADQQAVEPVRMIGLLNILFLLSVVVSVAISVNTPWREAIMFAASGLSLMYATQSPNAMKAREKNKFNFTAIIEVAAVFAGIFVTMIPALILLNKKGGALGVDVPLEFFYATGIFSSFLDNAPTFLVFTELAQGVTGAATAGDLSHGSNAVILAAVSLGAVFMGANTYIGNAPNFMVKSISEQQGVKMPSFFGYMLWALMFCIPVFTLVAVVFLVLVKFPLY